MTSIVKIAKLANVSKMTVSNVINKKYEKVSQETRERVERILAENNYTPNLFARNLKSNRSKIILFAIPQTLENDPHKDTAFSNPFYGELINSVEYNLRKEGYFLMIRFVSDEEVLNSLIVNWNIDGVIVLGAIKRELKTVFGNVDVPMVYIDTYTDNESLDTINVQDFEGAYQAVNYLLSKNRKKIAIAVSSIHELGVAQMRYRGYRRALDEARIEFQPQWLYEGFPSGESGEEIGHMIAQKREAFDAIFVYSDMMAIGVIKGLKEQGIRVPQDISVVGFDGLYIGDLIEPKLTTVRQDINTKGERAVEVLLNKIVGKTTETQQLVLPVELVLKESV